VSVQDEHQTPHSSDEDFGANGWLIEEMRDSWAADPGSVPSEWQDFFGATPGVPAAADGNGHPAATQVDAPAPDRRAAPGGDAAAPVPGKAAAPARTPAATSNGSAPAPGGAVPAAHTPPAPATGAQTTALKGASARVVANMEASLHVPTATSVRAVPAKLLEDNRTVINRHLARARGGKVSFTHLIGFALVRAVRDLPEMNHSYSTIEGKPTLVTPDQVGLGLAIDLTKSNGDRQLVVAAVKAADRMSFAQFWAAYEDIVRRARQAKLTTEDFSGVTVSLTNPGGFGTVHSVPRLTEGQGAIIGVGSMEYPAEFQGASRDTIARLGVSKVITLTSTYDHRVIQGAQSGEFLRRMHQLLLGEDGFYDEIFTSLEIPYEPVRWTSDVRDRDEGDLGKEARVQELIHAYRVRGHLIADTDPLTHAIKTHPDLDVRTHGLTLWDLDRDFAVGDFARTSGQKVMPLRDVLGVLRDAYCRTVGVEYMHLQDPDQRAWLQARVERRAEKPDRGQQLHVLERLGAAEAFEAFLQTKYVGQKRFSLEGAESTIPVLDEVIAAAAQDGLDEVVIGMPHRGRLNVLANTVGKSYAQIFREFEGAIDPGTAHGSGDVKYHLGASGTFRAPDGSTTTVSLCSNPSHLEAVDGVLEGVVRAKQDVLDKGEGPGAFSVVPLMMHGDAAFAGQGVVAETLNLSQLRGYRTGGTVHVVVNNQVGFTTDPREARSSVYATDVARMVQAPIFHVNGDDPDACVRVARLAYEYRRAFHKDVVIDLVCYRRRGHNEGDDPSMTQPVMYRTIEAKRSTFTLYREALVGRGDIEQADADAAVAAYRATLEGAFGETRDAAAADGDGWSNSTPPQPQVQPAVATAVSRDVLDRIATAQTALPPGFTPHPRVRTTVLDKRAGMLAADAVDWGFGETLAFGTLLLDGHPVRLAGQDSRRGTFTQRHAVVVDHETGEDFVPLRHLGDGPHGPQARFHVYDSLLSEYAAMAFEYGYSVTRPEALVAWEAQFGDFVNGAQTVVDEFISSGEAKWGQRTSVVLLLPHGYEGQGPDHSSAHIERFLALCAEDNMVVAYPSTPASYFHLLRRHVLSDRQKPLIVFTPKSMLRLKAATSPASAFTEGGFREVLPDTDLAERLAGQGADAASVRTVLLTAGKVHYDLLAHRGKAGVTDTALLRVEQLYPLPGDPLRAALEVYPQATDVVWVQEEPANQGAWPTMALQLPELLPAGRTLRRVSRRASASPAVGSAKAHEAEQIALVQTAFGGR